MIRLIFLMIMLLSASSSNASDKKIFYNKKGGFYPPRCSYVTIENGEVYVFVCQHIKGVVKLVLKDTLKQQENQVYVGSKSTLKIYDSYCELMYQDKLVKLYPASPAQTDHLEADEVKVQK